MFSQFTLAHADVTVLQHDEAAIKACVLFTHFDLLENQIEDKQLSCDN